MLFGVFTCCTRWNEFVWVCVINIGLTFMWHSAYSMCRKSFWAFLCILYTLLYTYVHLMFFHFPQSFFPWSFAFFCFYNNLLFIRRSRVSEWNNFVIETNLSFGSLLKNIGIFQRQQRKVSFSHFYFKRIRNIRKRARSSGSSWKLVHIWKKKKENLINATLQCLTNEYVSQEVWTKNIPLCLTLRACCANDTKYDFHFFEFAAKLSNYNCISDVFIDAFLEFAILFIWSKKIKPYLILNRLAIDFLEQCLSNFVE